MSDIKSNFFPISPEEEAIGKAVVNAAYTVHKALGSGLVEKACLCGIF